MRERNENKRREGRKSLEGTSTDAFRDILLKHTGRRGRERATARPTGLCIFPGKDLGVYTNEPVPTQAV